jgi:HEAT repeat protein
VQLSDWREWWKRNAWQFNRVAVKHVEATGETEGEPGKTWHQKKIEGFLLPLLGDRQNDVRASACIALGKLREGGDALRAALDKAVHDPDKDVRVSAMTALGLLKCKASAPLLTGILGNAKESGGVRGAAAVGLGMLGDSANIRTLTRTADPAREKRADVRAASVLGLGLIQDERAVAFLWKVLWGRDKEEIKALAASALAKSTNRMVVLRNGGKAKKYDLVRAFESLLADRATKPQVKRSVAMALGTFADARSVPALKRAVQRDKDAMVRAFALISLAEIRKGGIRDQGIQTALQRFAASEKDRTVRPYALLALGITGDPRGAEVLRHAFLEGSTEERGAAALGLGMVRDAGAIPMLGEEIAMPRTAGDARWYCCEALGMMGKPESGQRLRWALENVKNPFIQAAACKGLAILGDRTVVPRVVANLDAKNRVVRTWAARSLGYFCARSTIPRLIQYFEGEKEEEVRALAIVSLGMIGEGRKVMPALRRISDHCNWMAAGKFPVIALLTRLI